MTIDDYLTGIERGLRQNAHIGPTDRLAPADQPTLSLVLAEIENWLGQ